jgi:KGK domain
MQLISIAPKIYNRTRPPHQSNTEQYIFTPNIFNHYKIMIDRSKQIIPDLEAVARCLDPDMLSILNSHSTFTISELLEKIKQPINPVFSKDKVDNIFDQSRTRSSYSKDAYYSDLKNAILSNDTNALTIINILMDGTICNLLAPDGKGWQKGLLKICFQFIPEENEPIATQEKSVETQASPLDEIRQLSNELASVGSINQN